MSVEEARGNLLEAWMQPMLYRSTGNPNDAKMADEWDRRTRPGQLIDRLILEVQDALLIELVEGEGVASSFGGTEPYLIVGRATAKRYLAMLKRRLDSTTV